MNKALLSLTCFAFLAVLSGSIGSETSNTTTNDLETEIVATGFIPYFDMGVDSNGIPHIAYDEAIIDQLFYTNRTGGTWQSPQSISGTSDVFSTSVSLEVDTLGTAHIAFDSGIGSYDTPNLYTEQSRNLADRSTPNECNKLLLGRR